LLIPYFHIDSFSKKVFAGMGGKMALVASDMSKWFSSLWQGQQLAFTVPIITVAVAADFRREFDPLEELRKIPSYFSALRETLFT